MTQDFGPCGKCGQPTPIYSHMVPSVTWLGRPVCGTCEGALASGVRKKHRNFATGLGPMSFDTHGAGGEG